EPELACCRSPHDRLPGEPGGHRRRVVRPLAAPRLGARRRVGDTGDSAHQPWRYRRGMSTSGAAEAVVFDAVRTPCGRGRAGGALHGVKPVSLVAGLIDEIRKRNPTLDVDRLADLVLGVATPLGDQGGDLARAAALVAGLPDDVGGLVVN